LVGALGDPIFYQVSAPRGSFLTGWSDAPINADSLDLPGGQPVFFDSVYYGRPVRVVMLREFISDPQFDGWTTVQVWQTVTQRAALSLQLLAQAGMLLAVVLVSAAVLVWFGIGWGLRPLTDLRAAVGLRSPDELGPIRRPVPREVRPLVSTMNSLFARLRDAFERRDGFIANAAHQLRNPIASIQAQAEAAMSARSEAELRRRVADLTEAARRVSRLTKQLLNSDIAAARAIPADAPVLDITDLAASVARRHVPDALAKQVDLRFEVAQQDEKHCVRGDAVLIEEAIDNLLDNALRYGAREGGNVVVSVQGSSERVKVSIADDGPGIPPERSDWIFERFTRLRDDGSAGCGLGLSIVRTIASRHGGTVELRSGPPDSGTTFTLELPRSKPEEVLETALS